MTSEKDGDNASTMHPLLRRAFIYLEDGEWKAADEYCEKVLDQEPENAEAYLGKLMAELHCPNRACLMKQEKPFDEMGNYKRTLRFASPELKAELMEYMAYINDRNEQNRISSLDNVACQKMESAHTEEANQSACLRNQASYIAAKAKKKRVKTVIGTVVLFSLLVSIIFVIFWNQVRIPNREYSKALELYNNGLYMEAIAVWDALGDYKDSKERSTHAKYLQAGQLYCEGNFEAAITIFEELGDYKDSSERVLNHNNNQLKLYQMRNCSVGDTVRFGRYEQDNDITNGDEEIEWIVLEKEDNRILVISKYILDAVQYNKYKTDITWENCTLRGWLNSSFLDEAFAVEEQPWIPAVTVANADNPNYGTPAGNTTTDRIFLLSLDEFAQYFGSNHVHFKNANDWVGRGTAYAKAKGLYMDDNDLSWWWLRTPGVHADDVARVSTGSGSSRSEGYGVDYSYDGLRPAMWISFEETKAPDTNNNQKEYGNSEAQNAYAAGDTVKFGRYEQDIYSDGKEEIEWTVLAVKDNRMLVVSKRILDCAPYNSIKKDVTWEMNCSPSRGQ